MRLTGLFVHPVKSVAAVAVETADVLPRGLRFDRRWMITDASGRFQSQREDPRIGRLTATIEGDDLILNAPEATSPLTIPAEPSGRPDRRVTVWDDEVEAVDAGDEAAAWLARWLGPDRRLAGLTPTSRRPIDPTGRKAHVTAEDEVSFADGYPYLLGSQASLAELERRAGRRVDMRRFRPNLVIDGDAPFAEDHWAMVHIGEVRFRAVKPCVRCVVTTLDPDTGQAGHEPLRTLATFRRDPSGGVTFGHNLIATTGGRIRVGDEVVAEARIPDAAPR